MESFQRKSLIKRISSQKPLPFLFFLVSISSTAQNREFLQKIYKLYFKTAFLIIKKQREIGLMSEVLFLSSAGL